MGSHRHVFAAAALAAVSLTVGGCDWQKIYTFGSSSGWERPNNTEIELAPQVRLAEVALQPVAGRKMVIPAPAGGRVAYIRATPDAADREPEHIFVDAGGRCWEVLGLPHGGKPLENLHWEGATSDALVVERWHTATEGIRVFIDMNTASVFYAQPVTRAEPSTKP